MGLASVTRLCLVVAALVHVADAQELGRVRLLQAKVDFPSAVVYFNGSLVDGPAVRDLSAADMRFVVGPFWPETVAITPFPYEVEGCAYIFVVDVSRSIKSGQFAETKQVMVDFVDRMGDRDRVAIITFGESVRRIASLETERTRLTDKIQGLQATDDWTNLYAGLIEALRLGRSDAPGLPNRRVVVVMSDGHDENALVGGETESEVSQLWNQDSIPIYGIGFRRSRRDAPYLGRLGRLARTTGGLYQEIDAGVSPDMVLTAVRRDIESSLVATLMMNEAQPDGNVYPIQATPAVGTREPSNLIYAPLRGTLISTTEDEAIPGWVYPTVGIGVVGLVLGVAYLVRRRPSSVPPLAQTPGSLPSYPASPLENSTAGGGQPTRPGVTTASTAGAAIQLAVLGSNQRYEMVIDSPVTLGKGADCGLALLADQGISKQHCEFRGQNGGIYIRDLGSTNGTLINGVPILNERRIEDGDVIQVGSTELRVMIDRA